MRKFIPTHLIIFISVLVLLNAIIAESCRKIDRFATDQQQLSSKEIETKFFNSHRSGDTKEKAIVDFLKRINDKEHFVLTTVKRIGYPRWDKTVSIAEQPLSTNNFGGNDSISLSIIPFVKDSQNNVNSLLAVKIEGTDTSYKYFCDWQYQEKSYGSYDDTTAEKYSLLFMFFDNEVFGHQQFRIKDSSLFNYLPAAANDTIRRIGVVGTSLETSRSNLYGNILEICMLGYICYWPESNECRDGCDWLTCDATPNCTGINVCWEYEVITETGGWTLGTTGGGGGGSEGGGENGGSTPPECPGGPIGTSGRSYSCGSGWIPVEDEPPPPPLDDSTVAANLNRLYLKAISLSDSLFTKAQQDKIERTFTYVKDGSNDTIGKWPKPGSTYSSSPTLSGDFFAIWHSHQDEYPSSDNRNQCFDAADLLKLYKNATIDNYPLTASLITTRDFVYAVVIIDKPKFRNYWISLSGSSNYYVIDNKIDSVHIKVWNDCTCSWQAGSEVGTMAVSANNNSAISGIKIYKTSRNNIAFIPL